MEKAFWVFRIWGIRHIRAAWHTYQMERHYAFYRSIGMLPFNKQSDLDTIDLIRKGEL